jgi:hypothetical protein
VSTAYNSFFLGSVQVNYKILFWTNWAPLKKKIFMWPALQNHWWTGERLIAKGLPSPADQHSESMNHLMVQCPTAKFIWFQILAGADLTRYLPQPDNNLRER